MKKYISLMNAYSFYYLWNSEFKYYFEDLINEILGINEKYELLETLNNTTNYLRSYLFLESDNNIVYIDFNKSNNSIILDEDLILFNYLKITSNKKINLIMFNSYQGINSNKDDIYLLYKNSNNNEFLKLLLSQNFKEQSKSNLKEIIDYLYNLDNEFYLSYLREEKLKEDNKFKNKDKQNIYKTHDI